MTEAWIDELRNIVGPRNVITGSDSLAWESDGFSLVRGQGRAIVLPLDTNEIVRVMQLLAQEGVPVVPRGAGTGLTGGASPVQGGVTIGTSRMKRIFCIDPIERTAHVQAGVVNSDLSLAAKPHGLFYAPDPSSQAACTLGGNVANNSGGPHCFMHGATTRHVRGLKLVDAQGEILDLLASPADPAGLDLVGLINGSEGMFGVVTEINFHLEVIPEEIQTIIAVFSSLDAACDCVSEAIAAHIEASAIEILDKLTITAVEDSVYAAGYPRDAEAVLLVEAEGGALEVQETIDLVLQLAKKHKALETRRASDGAERARLWAGRKGAFGAMGRVAPDLYVADVVAPRTRLREIVHLAVEIAEERNLRLGNVFHAGDGNLHPNIAYDRRDEDEVRRVLEAGRLIMEACIERGGSLTGEHGVGLEKMVHMCDLFNDDDLNVMHRVRDAIDPKRRMNPTKVLPLRACREVRNAGLPLSPMAYPEGKP